MVQIKQEPMSDSEESMDTSGAVPNGSVNGYPSSDSPNTDLHSEYGTAQAPTPELQDFVRSTFRKHFVLCLSEVKRLFNLHLASLPTGHSRFGHVTDRMLQDTILHSHCKQILVPVSTLEILFQVYIVSERHTAFRGTLFGWNISIEQNRGFS